MQRAFVIQLRRDTDPSEGHFAGKIEHVLSGKVSHFGTLVEFMQFIGTVLQEESDEVRQTPSRADSTNH